MVYRNLDNFQLSLSLLVLACIKFAKETIPWFDLVLYYGSLHCILHSSHCCFYVIQIRLVQMGLSWAWKLWWLNISRRSSLWLLLLQVYSIWLYNWLSNSKLRSNSWRLYFWKQGMQPHLHRVVLLWMVRYIFRGLRGLNSRYDTWGREHRFLLWLLQWKLW